LISLGDLAGMEGILLKFAGLLVLLPLLFLLVLTPLIFRVNLAKTLLLKETLLLLIMRESYSDSKMAEMKFQATLLISLRLLTLFNLLFTIFLLSIYFVI